MIDMFKKNRRGTAIADRIEVGDCWEWTGARTAAGYGHVSVEGHTQYVHRLVWESLVGPIGSKLETDHLCRNRVCCNPDHIQMVTHAENVRRGMAGKANNWMKAQTHCPQGHLLEDGNLVSNGPGRKRCRICNRKRSLAYYYKRKESS